MTKRQLLRERRSLQDEIAALRAENLGLRMAAEAPRSEDAPESIAGNGDTPAVPDSPQEEEAQANKPSAFSRFPLLRAVDEEHAGCTLPEPPAAGQPPSALSPQPIQLLQIAEHLRRYAAAHFGIYAGRALYAYFLGAMAASDFILLRCEERTGSDSRERSALLLCSAMAAAFGREIGLTAVRPHWTRPADLLGEAGAQAWRYNETRFLRTLYAAGWQDGICFAALEGVTAAPPEGYLQTLLPVLSLRGEEEAGGMPAFPLDLRTLPLAQSAWPGDPVLLREGALPYPENLWLFGTLPEGAPPPGPRVRECAMELCLPARQGKPFPAPLTSPMDLPARHLREMFARAQDAHALPEEPLRLARMAEDYLAAHMEISLGAEMETHLRRFGSTCLACGLGAAEALDGFFYHKALRRLESADPFALRCELPGLRRFLRETFGRHALPLTMGYLEAFE